MTSKLASNHASKEHSSARARQRRVGPSAFYLAGALAVAATACSSDKTPATDGKDAAGTDSEFESCMANVQPLCKTREQDTAEKMQTPCKAVEFISFPLTDGTRYGPKTIDAGPYASKLDWNQGAGTEFVNQVDAMKEGQICNPGGIDSDRKSVV